MKLTNVTVSPYSGGAVGAQGGVLRGHHIICSTPPAPRQGGAIFYLYSLGMLLYDFHRRATAAAAPRVGVRALCCVVRLD